MQGTKRQRGSTLPLSFISCRGQLVALSRDVQALGLCSAAQVFLCLGYVGMPWERGALLVIRSLQPGTASGACSSNVSVWGQAVRVTGVTEWSTVTSNHSLAFLVEDTLSGFSSCF